MVLIANKKTKQFHAENCNYVDKILPENLIFFETPQEALDAGYYGCAYCQTQYDESHYHHPKPQESDPPENSELVSLIITCNDKIDNVTNDELRVDITVDGYLLMVEHYSMKKGKEIHVNLPIKVIFSTEVGIHIYEDDGTDMIPNWYDIGHTHIGKESGEHTNKMKGKHGIYNSLYTAKYVVESSSESAKLECQIERMINAFDEKCKGDNCAWKAPVLNNEDGKIKDYLKKIMEKRLGGVVFNDKSSEYDHCKTWEWQRSVLHQNDMGACSEAALCHEWIRIHPLMFIQQLMYLYTEGKIKVLKTYEASDNLLGQSKIRASYNIYPISWMLFTTLADATNIIKYDWAKVINAGDETLEKNHKNFVVFHGYEAIKEWGKNVLLYKENQYENVSWGNAMSKLKPLRNSVFKGASVFMNIHSALVLGGPEDTVYGDLTETHWVPLLDKEVNKINSPTIKEEGLEFFVYSWELYYKIQATKKVIGKLFVNYVICSDNMYELACY